MGIPKTSPFYVLLETNFLKFLDDPDRARYLEDLTRNGCNTAENIVDLYSGIVADMGDAVAGQSHFYELSGAAARTLSLSVRIKER